jgi:hypothetical protein
MAKKEKKIYQRLPVTFHQTFAPERTHISALLRFTASGKEGTEQEISAETGIPTGQSSGKVPAMLDYCTGMGLLSVEKGSQAGKKFPKLTDFGRTVLLEDANLTEELTQWMAHLLLCRRYGGAEVWHLSFGVSYDVLGIEFSEEGLEEYLTGILGRRKRSLIGPMIRMYDEPASFKKAGTIAHENKTLRRMPAPILSGFGNGYAASLLSLWEGHFPKERQVTLADFEAETYWQRICGWNDRQYLQILEILESNGAIVLDKQMRPWVLTRRAESQNYWRTLYDELA